MGSCVSSPSVAEQTREQTRSTPQQSLTLKQRMDPFAIDVSNWNLELKIEDLGLQEVHVQDVTQNINLIPTSLSTTPSRRPVKCIRMVVEEERNHPIAPFAYKVPALSNRTEKSFVVAHTAQVVWKCHKHCPKHQKQLLPSSSAAGSLTRSLLPVDHGDTVRILLRPIVSADKDSLRQGLGVLSEKSKFTRFLSSMNSFSDGQLELMCRSNNDRFAWGLLVWCGVNHGWVSVGVGRFVRELNHCNRAEVAFTILDRWQGKCFCSFSYFS